MTWELRPYQKEQIRAIKRAWRDGDRALIVAATGTGKTTTIAEVIRGRADAGRGRALVVAHRLELLEQIQKRLAQAGIASELESGEHAAIRHEVMGGAPVVVATVQSLKGRRLSMWDRAAFPTIIIDEAHHATAAGYRAVLDHFTGAKVLGVTATPDRGDDVALGHVFPDVSHEYNLRTAIEEGHLSPVRARAIDTPHIDLSSVRVTNQEHGRDYSARDLARMMEGEGPLHKIAVPIAEKYEGRQTIVFVPSVEVARALAGIIAPYIGGPELVASLDGGSETEHRKRTIAAYLAGDIRMLINCALFTEGFDAPNTACVAIARPTKSRALYAQMVGRGTRLAPGKTDCLVLDLAPSNARHQLVAPIDLLSGKPLPDDLLADARAAMSGDDVLEALKRAEKHADERTRKAEAERRSGRLVADVHYTVSERDPLWEALDKADNEDLRRLIARKRKGLCSIKQMRVLARAGLRTDLTAAQAKRALDLLAQNNWRATPELVQAFA